MSNSPKTHVSQADETVSKCASRRSMSFPNISLPLTVTANSDPQQSSPTTTSCLLSPVTPNSLSANGTPKFSKSATAGGNGHFKFPHPYAGAQAPQSARCVTSSSSQNTTHFPFPGQAPYRFQRPTARRSGVHIGSRPIAQSPLEKAIEASALYFNNKHASVVTSKGSRGTRDGGLTSSSGYTTGDTPSSSSKSSPSSSPIRQGNSFPEGGGSSSSGSEKTSLQPVVTRQRKSSPKSVEKKVSSNKATSPHIFERRTRLALPLSHLRIVPLQQQNNKANSDLVATSTKQFELRKTRAQQEQLCQAQVIQCLPKTGSLIHEQVILNLRRGGSIDSHLTAASPGHEGQQVCAILPISKESYQQLVTPVSGSGPLFHSVLLPSSMSLSEDQVGESDSNSQKQLCSIIVPATSGYNTPTTSCFSSESWFPHSSQQQGVASAAAAAEDSSTTNTCSVGNITEDDLDKDSLVPMFMVMFDHQQRVNGKKINIYGIVSFALHKRRAGDTAMLGSIVFRGCINSRTIFFLLKIERHKMTSISDLFPMYMSLPFILSAMVDKKSD